jgi:4a-hydroxytetrahydrobiopterin dehydratase
MAVISVEAAQARLGNLAGWKIESGELVRTFEFKDFAAALDFVNRVGKLAEQAGHHPDIDIRYNRVRLALVTHSAGGLTEKDFELAGQIQKTA